MTIDSILQHYGIQHATTERILGGNLNLTFKVQTPHENFILQRLNPVFDPLIHTDIERITKFLDTQGMLTPKLIPTTENKLWYQDKENHAWRLFTYIDGQTFMHCAHAGIAFEAGALLGNFHRCLSPLDYQFTSKRRSHVHDTPRHLAYLKETLQRFPNHRYFKDVQVLANSLLNQVEALQLPTNLPIRLVHGDPKISNIIFSRTSEQKALAMVDLDTLNHMPIPLELGDALRSWCNPQGEDNTECTFDSNYFEQALKGYKQGIQNVLTPQEIQAIPLATEIITLELTSRFAADALAENYFGFNQEHYATLGEHNLVRATTQWHLAQSIAEQRQQLKKLTEAIF